MFQSLAFWASRRYRAMSATCNHAFSSRLSALAAIRCLHVLLTCVEPGVFGCRRSTTAWDTCSCWRATVMLYLHTGPLCARELVPQLYISLRKPSGQLEYPWEPRWQYSDGVLHRREHGSTPGPPTAVFQDFFAQGPWRKRPPSAAICGAGIEPDSFPGSRIGCQLWLGSGQRHVKLPAHLTTDRLFPHHFWDVAYRLRSALPHSLGSDSR